MTNNQSKIRRPCPKLRKIIPTQGTMGPGLDLSQGSSRALTPAIVSTSPGSDDIRKRIIARLKNLLPNRSSRSIASSSIGPHDLQQSSTPAAPAYEIDAVQEELDSARLVLPVAQHAVELVGGVNTVVSQIETISSTYLQPLKTFSTVVSTITNVHPYAHMALGTLTSAAQLIIMQANLDQSISDLLLKVQNVYEFLLEEDTLSNLDVMKDTLARIAQVISNCARFIKNYPETKSFWKRVGKNIRSETQTAVDDYNKALDALMQQHHNHAVCDMHINIYRDLEDLNLDGMAYASGAGLNTTKKCLDGTRGEILQEIVDWIHDPDVNAPRIFWLHGQAGRGKSAIAHTIALWLRNVGGLGSCFCFARDRQAEYREEKMFTTISRDLADRDPAFRRALASIFTNNRSLMATPDIIQQWEKLVLGPLSQVSTGETGSVVVVIDALDESGPEPSRSHILSVLGSPRAAKLPSNFRLLMTSRSLPDIQAVLSISPHVKALSLDDVPVTFTERDIRLFVSVQLKDLKGIGEREVSQIAQKADGLFEWARLACEYIKQDTTGKCVKERFSSVTEHVSREGKSLLDAMYHTILESAVSKRPTALARFCSVMRQVLYTLEPLPVDGLGTMRRHFAHKHSNFNVVIVLCFLGPLLSGVTDYTMPVRPLHASFSDFLTDQSRSGDYFVGEADIQMDIAVASLGVLRT
ncbi:hypothetical protein SCLCIDRAFT_1221930 [Scleroderma citrinum Foug A]|uniref:Nephrocystin 3-like N-terminal domain-containing protein n=1 Tax=Scleroderma citrinum Foug A TaxID=1036808 RepID=A0A0C3DDG4_9AGAM|nr:hypothetical protein SCLCIDRAFT_1221930 [Scleroderma citrinum Foug A]